MPFVELKSGKAGKEYVRMSQTKHGVVVVTFSPSVVERNKLVEIGRVRLLADLDSSPRVLRLIADKDGTFGVRRTKGGAGVVVVGRFSGLEKIRFEKSVVEFDEDEDGNHRPMIDVELPAALQPTSVPVNAGAGRASGSALAAEIAAVKLTTGNGRAR